MSLLDNASTAVLFDLLLQRGATEQVLERIRLALDPRSVILSPDAIDEWESARSPSVTRGAAPPTMAAVPWADRNLIAQIQKLRGP